MDTDGVPIEIEPRSFTVSLGPYVYPPEPQSQPNAGDSPTNTGDSPEIGQVTNEASCVDTNGNCDIVTGESAEVSDCVDVSRVISQPDQVTALDSSLSPSAMDGEEKDPEEYSIDSQVCGSHTVFINLFLAG